MSKYILKILLKKLNELYVLGYFKSTDDYKLVIDTINTLNTLILNTSDVVEKAEPMICDDCFHNTVCRLDGNEMLEWCSARVPSADVVEVVRCKDCKYYKHNKYYNTYCCCRKPKKFIDEYDKRKLDDYCSYAKRKEAEE